MIRPAMRKAIGGASESMSSAHATFIAWELPATSPTRVIAPARKAMVIHS
jgi:hypothetical protein